LHVVTPLSVAKRSKLGWPEAKAFAREICVRLAKQAPNRHCHVNLEQTA
jgi:bifunctional non-homologous end joining protein LigD